MIEEPRRALEELRSRYEALAGHLDPEGATARMQKLEESMSAPGFWDEGGDPALLRERSQMQERLQGDARLRE